MKHIIWGVLFTFYCGMVVASAQASGKPVVAASVASTAGTSAANRERALTAYGRLPLSFEANWGQTADAVRFLARGDGYTLFLTPTGAVLTLPDETSGAQGPNLRSSVGKDNVLRMELRGAKPNAQIEGEDELPGKSNYFIGNDPKKWHVGVPTFRRVEYKNPYPGIELAYYGNQRELEYDFIVAPGADPDLIQLKIDGTSGREIDKNGNLLFRVGDRRVQFSAPNVYQDDGNRRRTVEGRWVASGKEQFRFRLGVYDHSKALVIDPKVVPVAASTVPLAFSTYLGGSLTDVGNSVALDGNRDIYIAGFTASSNFPGVSNTFTGATGQNVAFITEIDPAGSFQIYSTYLEGNPGNGDTANGIAVDGSGNAFVVGTTFSSTFPATNGFQQTCAGNCTDGDAFISELDSNGTLVFSSFLGGTGTEQGNGIALSPQGSAYIVGWTSSTDFPTASPYQSSNAGGASDGFLAAVLPPGDGGNATLVFSTYLGGSGVDVASAVAVDASGNVNVAGFTTSPDFPHVNGVQSSCGGCASGFSSAFISQFNSDNGLDYSTFLGGTTYPNGNSTDGVCGKTKTFAADQACGVSTDPSGNVYVTGVAVSTDFPTVNAFQSSCKNNCSGGDAFVAKLSADGKSINYSTYLGGSGDDRATAIAVDSVGNAVVTGQTSSTDFPLNQGFEVYPTCSACAGGGRDAFVAELAVPGTPLIYSSYLGGTTTQSGLGIALTSDQAVVTGGTKSASGFPIVSSNDSVALQPTFGGVEDAFLTEFPEGVACSISTAGSPTGSNLTVTATLACFGNFVVNTSDNNEFLGFLWQDGTIGSGSGCGSCQQSAAGSVTFSSPLTSQASGTFPIAATANDQFGAQLVTTGFAVNVAMPVVSISTTTLGVGQVGTSYSQQVSAINGANPYTFSIASGTLPAGLTLAPGGLITGTPTATGTASFALQVKDTNGTTNTQALSINVTSPALTITTLSLAQGVVGVAYTETLAASGGTGLGYTWSLTTGTLPAGLALTGSTGVIAGTPTATGMSNFTVQVKDSGGNTATQALSITVTTPPPQLIVATTTLSGGTIDTAYTAATLQATGGTGPYTWSLISGTLPVGMSLSPQGTISGTPTTGGTFDFNVQVMDSTGATANTYSFNPPLSITITAPAGAPTCKVPTITASTSNPLVVTASSNCSDSSVTIASTSIDWGDGSSALQGTSGSHTYSAGTYTITVTATDTNKLSATATGSITVTGPVTTAVPQGGSVPPQTNNVTAPLGVPSVMVTYTCTTANGPSGGQSLSAYGLACSFSPSNSSSEQVTLTNTPTTVTVTVTTTGASGQIAPSLRRAGWLYAMLMPMPGFVLLGIGSCKRRKYSKRYAGLALLGLMIWGGLGCGVGSPKLSSTVVTQQTVTPAGAYSVNVTGADSSGNTQSTITVGFSVSGA